MDGGQWLRRMPRTFALCTEHPGVFPNKTEAVAKKIPTRTSSNFRHPRVGCEEEEEDAAAKRQKNKDEKENGAKTKQVIAVPNDNRGLGGKKTKKFVTKQTPSDTNKLQPKRMAKPPNEIRNKKMEMLAEPKKHGRRAKR